jgi:hypothetical protein
LHSGEGPIHAVKWRTSLIAWANDAGVKVYDTANDQRITFIERPRGSPRPELLLPHLVWQVSQILTLPHYGDVLMDYASATASAVVSGLQQ